MIFADRDDAGRRLAARLGHLRGEPVVVRAEQARSVVASFLARMPGGGWLSAEEADGVLRCYGLSMVEFRRVADADAAVAAAAGLRGHVVLRLTCPACCTRPRPAPSN